MDSNERLQAIIAAGQKAKTEGERTDTLSPLEQFMDRVDPPAPPPLGIGDTIKRAWSSDPAIQAEDAQRISQEQETNKAMGGAAVRVGADALSRGWSENLMARMKGTTRAQEVAETEKSKQMIGSGASAAVGFAGTVAPYLLMRMPTTLIGSGVVGGGAGMIDTTIRRAAEGKLPDAEELALSAVFGFGGGAIGNILGKTTSGAWNYFTRGKTPMPPHMMKAIEQESKLVDEGGKMIDNSGVVIKGRAMQKLVQIVDRKLEGVVTPEGTPKAWMALHRFKSALGKTNVLGEPKDITLRQFNNIRRGIMEIKGKKYEQNNINEILGTMRHFIDTLPSRKAIIAAGDAKMGVEGWKKMNEHFQNKLKLEAFTEKFAFAAAKAKNKTITLDNALQEEFMKWTTTKAGKKEFHNLFTEAERKALMPLTEGPITTQALNAIDRSVGKNFYGSFIRILRASVAHAPAGEAAQNMVNKAFGQLPGGVVPAIGPSTVKQTAGKIGAATGAETLHDKLNE